MTDAARVREAIATDGYLVVDDVLDAAYARDAKAALERAIEAEARWHGGREYADYGMVLVCPMYGRIFADVFDNPRVTAPFEAVLGEGCIVYAYTSSSMPPQASNYSTRIHVDCPRIIPAFVTNMGVTLLLDDFTEENGATWYLPRSQTRADAPSEEEFRSHAKRLVARAGSALFFDARLWHAGGDNRTAAWRHALTINMCRPWMKQRIDLPRALEGCDLAGASEKALQKLGFRSRVPASLDEYYAPPERRTYTQRTE
jgi:ectoine hydroxylase-related dioxygenase (phytanoyl-CoA dioxygenase family)